MKKEFYRILETAAVLIPLAVSCKGKPQETSVGIIPSTPSFGETLIVPPTSTYPTRIYPSPEATKTPEPFATETISETPIQSSEELRELPENPVCIATGFNPARISHEKRDKQLELIRDSGAKWVRFDFILRNIDRRSNEFNREWLDETVDKALSMGLGVIGTLPQWGPLDGEWMSTMSVNEYEQYVRQTAAHFKGRVKKWEVGNEPNYELFWPEGPDVAEYVPYLKAAYTAIKSQDRDATVISGGIMPDDPIGWLNGLYKNGAKGYFDAFGYHPYTQPNPPTEYNFTVMGELNQIMREKGDEGLISVTEIGWPTGESDESVTVNQQAAHIGQALDIVASSHPYVTDVCVYRLQDPVEPNPKDPEDNFGIVTGDNIPKPAYEVIRKFSKRFEP